MADSQDTQDSQDAQDTQDSQFTAASSPPSSVEGASDVESENDSIVYTPEELADIFLDFYTFLTTLHFDKADLKIPPPGGWADIIPETYKEFKSDHAIEVLRLLPYFKSKAEILYATAFEDWTSQEPELFKEKDWRQEPGIVEYYSSAHEECDEADCFIIATGSGSQAHCLVLNSKAGEIINEQLRCTHVGVEDVEYFFDNLKEDLKTLKEIPRLGHVSMNVERVEERQEEIDVEEVRAQTKDFGTDLDIQYVRQVYRQCGWPDAFRRDEAMQAMDDLDASMGHRETWEKDDIDEF